MQIDTSKKTIITAKEVSAKFRSKNEIYRFMTVDVGAYLPPKECVTIYWLKELARGHKKYIKTDDVKFLNVPQYKGLSIEKMLEKGEEDPEVAKYLPETEDDFKRLPRQFIANVTYKVMGQPFKLWVDELIEKRNTDLAENTGIAIDFDPEIAKAFKASTHISTQKGNSCHLLKAGSKRRRTQAEIKDQNTKKELRERAMEEAEESAKEQAQQIAQLQQRLEAMEREKTDGQQAMQLMQKLAEAGDLVQDEDGTWVVGRKPNIIGNQHEQL